MVLDNLKNHPRPNLRCIHLEPYQVLGYNSIHKPRRLAGENLIDFTITARACSLGVNLIDAGGFGIEMLLICMCS